MVFREYPTLRALRNGETVEVDGCLVRASESQELVRGVMYVGERNTAPRLGFVRYVDERGWVASEDQFIYPYDVPECVVVEFVED